MKLLTREEYLEDCLWGISALQSLYTYQHTYGISDLGMEIVKERERFLFREAVNSTLKTWW